MGSVDVASHRLVSRGRLMMLGIIAVFILAEVALLALEGNARYPVARVLLTAALLFAMWRGQKWASLFVTLVFLAGGAGLIVGGAMAASGALVLLGLPVMVLVILLMFSDALAAFLAHQRESIAARVEARAQAVRARGEVAKLEELRQALASGDPAQIEWAEIELAELPDAVASELRAARVSRVEACAADAVAGDAQAQVEACNPGTCDGAH